MAFTEQLTQALSIPAASLYPQNRAFDNTNAAVVGPINMNVFRRAMAHVVVGVVTTNSNIQAYFQASNANNGTFANISSGPTIGNVNTSNTEYTLEIRADQMPSGKPWLQLAVLVNVANAFLSASLYGGESGYKPASQYDINTTLLPTRAVANI